MNIGSKAVSYWCITNHLKKKGFKTTLIFHESISSSTDLDQLDFDWAQPCVMCLWLDSRHLGAEWSVAARMTALLHVASQRSRKEAETCKAPGG